ncbi:MAG: threonine-phosphate decarboxylase [Geobacteraceae bacterium]|nr:threonine-phosphate decarboxylase [Geobacteraceae bacterium]
MHKSFSHGGRILSLAKQMDVSFESILDFSASINPLGVSPLVKKAVAAAMKLAGHYPEAGSPSLCQALAQYHSIPVETIAVANGSTELIHLIPRLFRRAAGRALIIAPAFSEYTNSLHLAGWEYSYLNLSHTDGFTLNTAALAEELAKGYDICFFCNPGNPTGHLYTPEEIETVYWLSKSSGCFFVLDEAFIDFKEDFSAKALIPASDSGMILRSMTKFFGFPGIRVGYAIASSEVTSRIKRFLPPWNVGVIQQAAAIAALSDLKHCRETIEFVEKERRSLTDAFAKMSGLTVFECSANYLLVRLDNGMTADRLQNELLKELILIRNCSNFEGLDNRFFRVAVKGKAENKKLLQAIAGALKNSSIPFS